MLNKTSNYEPHIDGLRAIAVLSVMLFHFEVSFFKGGFVGVDIFFVITGFLITRSIINDKTKGSFSLYDFYIRRIRRVFPALLFTILIVFLLSAYIFPPQELQRIGGASVHAIVGISNIYFWQESGYFDTSATLKPLLHTWSLGVEEQFYLIWSVFILFFLSFFRKSKLIFPIIGVSILSLLASIYFLDYAPNKEQELATGSDTVFYLLPFRIFEFGIGAILAITGIAERGRLNPITSETLTIIGLALVIYAVIAYDKEMIFPSYNALIPCLGAALIIFSAKHSIIGKSFNNSLFVRIGLISYSIYLIHWPAYVFYSYSTLEAIDIFDQIALTIITIVLSILSYKYVETKFRHPPKTSSNEKGLLKLSIASLFVMTISAHAWANNGWSNSTISSTDRLTRDEWTKYTVDDQYVISRVAFHDYVWDKFMSLEKPFYDKSKTNILIIGDSMAGDLTNILTNPSLYDHANIEIRTQPIRHGCKSLIVITEQTVPPERLPTEKCQEQYASLAESINLQNADVILLASLWEKWALESLAATTQYIHDNHSASIIVVGNKHIAEQGLVAFKKNIKKINIAADTIAMNEKVSSKISSNASFIQITQYFCDETECPTTTDEGYLFYYDKSHLTPKGVEAIAQQISNNGGISMFGDAQRPAITH